jgi:hypothetical protein
MSRAVNAIAWWEARQTPHLPSKCQQWLTDKFPDVIKLKDDYGCVHAWIRNAPGKQEFIEIAWGREARWVPYNPVCKVCKDTGVFRDTRGDAWGCGCGRAR